MGLLGILLTVILLALGGGYVLFGRAPGSLTLTNDAPAPFGEALNRYDTLTAEATALKETVEARSEQEVSLAESAPSEPQESTGAPEEQKEIAGATNRLMSTGYSVPKKVRTIDTIVLHSSYNPNEGEAYSVESVVKIYESYGVSAHYLIDRKGNIFRLVRDEHVAYHAGVSKMPDGRKNVNDFSLGIEILNREDTEYTSAQYEAVNRLVGILKKQHGIRFIVGHGDIAPDRKTDPWNFDWKKLKY